MRGLVLSMTVTNSQVLFSCRRSTNVAGLGHMGTGEVALSTKGFRVFLLSVDVLT